MPYSDSSLIDSESQVQYTWYMKNRSDEYHTGRHCVFSLHVHLVFTPKYRRDVFQGKHLDALKTVFSSVCSDFGSKLVEMNGEHDHVHLLVDYPPNVELSKLVNSLKGVSSRLLRKAHPDISNRCMKNVLWSRSYFAASCGGAPLEIIRQYIEHQRTPD
jgi:putative transposase